MPRSIRITDTATGRVVGTIDSLPTRPNALAFDSTGRMLAAGFSEAGFADAGTTTVWNVAHGAEVGRMDAGDGEVWSHRFATDGRSIYSFGADGLHQWDLTGARAIVRTDTGAPISFRAGDVLMSMSDDSVEGWIAEACRLAGRSLTPEEWYANLGDVPYDPVC